MAFFFDVLRKYNDRTLKSQNSTRDHVYFDATAEEDCAIPACNRTYKSFHALVSGFAVQIQLNTSATATVLLFHLVCT
jgi:hypothetical protein